MITRKKTQQLNSMCGTYATAKHLRNLGYDLELALVLLRLAK